MATIKLSKYTQVLLDQFKKIKLKPAPDELSKISVSQTVTFFALTYERVRNAVEYREGHLIRRAAIERILRRRLAMNPKGQLEGENLIRELLWARYFPNETLDDNDIEAVQKIIDTYLDIMSQLLVGQTATHRGYYSQFLFQLMTCEIEEALVPMEARQKSLFNFFTYQVLKRKIKIENVTDEEKNASFYVALERGLNRSDLPYLRYHLFTLSHQPLSTYTKEELSNQVPLLSSTFNKIDTIINNPNSEKLRRFVKHHTPPFLILFELIKRRSNDAQTALVNSDQLWTDIEQLCREKYAQAQARLQTLALKAIIYIFLTKMLLAILLELPVSLYLFGDVNYIALIVNTLFPPALMFMIATFTRIPGQQNTKRIYERIVDIVDADKKFETSVSLILKQSKPRKSFLVFWFTIFYSLTFIITFGLLSELLTLFRFNFISQALFVFFVSVVTFFAYRVRQTAKEFQLSEKEAFYRPFIDFFFMPILSVGKFLSRSLSQLNFFAVIFDFIIEAPFKLIIEVVEEWIRFIRQKRDEII